MAEAGNPAACEDKVRLFLGPGGARARASSNGRPIHSPPQGPKSLLASANGRLSQCQQLMTQEVAAGTYLAPVQGTMTVLGTTWNMLSESVKE